MLIDAVELAPGAVIDADVCIIGAGAAGITIARELRASPLRVCLLESGGFEAADATQRLSVGVNLGLPYVRLDHTRSRFFGGSTNCWMGFCRPLDPDDFETRAWIPHSGWPFDRAALQPFYERAQVVCGLGPFRYTGAECAGPAVPELPLPEGDVVTRCFQIAAKRFGQAYRDEITAASNIDTLLHANVVEIEPGADSHAIERLHVRTLAGKAFSVRPRAVVLATGGIENARLLLASRRVHEAGVGNQNDLVGRFFMEHPHTVTGEFLPSSRARLTLYRRHRRGAFDVLGMLALSEAARRRERLANFTATLSEPLPLEPAEADLAAAVAAVDSRRRGVAASPTKHKLSNECEQVPNPESRVELAYDRDALGMNRVTLKWLLTAQDRDSLRRGHEILAHQLGSAGIGRIRVGLDAGEAWPPDLTGGRHHMGTTRMHANPRQGVVDADARVHGLANLFVAGSSVFPTGGSANPTLTIVALALRLADHLKARFA